MRRLDAKLLATSLPLLTFWIYGTFTEAGRRRYDEMDGLYPLGALILGGTLLLLAGTVFGVSILRRRKQ